jgi:hypothetical protein
MAVMIRFVRIMTNNYINNVKEQREEELMSVERS